MIDARPPGQSAASVRIVLVAAVLLGVLTGPLTTGAQPAGKTARVGVLLVGTPATDPNLAALTAGLRDLGWVEGKNLAFVYHSLDGRPERGPERARQLVALKPDVAVVLGGDIVPFLKEASGSIPIVMLTSQDPVEGGVIASFARPGGNVTGVAFISEETAARRLQFLKEAIPSLARVGVLWTPDHPDGEYRNAEAAARQLGVRVQSLEVRRPEDFETAFQVASRERVEALVVASSRFMNLNRSRVLDFASAQRIPLVSGWGPWVRAGGLMSYGPDLDTLVRRAATHVDKILKGAKPGELPVELPTKFELVVNRASRES